MKISNVRQSPITRDTLLIPDAYSKVKRRVTKLLLECSMRQFQNEIIASPDDGGLLGSRHAETNYVIFSDTMLRFLIVSAAMHLNILAYTWKCYKWHNHTSFCDYL